MRTAACVAGWRRSPAGPARPTGPFVQERVHGAENPRALGKALRGEKLWRYRVGDYRVLGHIDDDVLTVLVVELGHRREVYR